MGGGYSIAHAACLAAQLRWDSRIAAALSEAEEEQAAKGNAQGETLPIDEYMEILSRPRKEVQHGR